MLDAGGGGGGGTPWALLTVDEMYQRINSADTDKQWKLADGWKKSAELIASHRSQVQNYRDNLTAAWPPDKSKAAEAYVERLDVMIASLTETYEAALENYNAVTSATGSIYQAQVKMEKIYQEYKNNETLLANFAAKQQEQQNSTTPTPSPSPSGGEQPPVAAGRQEALRLQASSMLSGVSTDLAQAQARIARPAKYEPKNTSDGGGDGDGPVHVPPPIPPIVPAYSDGSAAGSTRPHTTFQPPATAVNPPLAPPPGGQPGLVLGGANPPVLTAPTAVNPPSLPITTGPTAGPGLLPPPSGLIPGGGTPSVLPPGIGVGPGTGVPREGTSRLGTPGPERMRVMPPGGVIGGTTPMGLVPPASGRAGAARVNPVGGVIGGSQSATGLRGGSASGTHPATQPGVYGQGGARRPRQNEETDAPRWDPDNPWETAEGVDPVVLPQREKRIDPGPAIGL